MYKQEGPSSKRQCVSPTYKISESLANKRKKRTTINVQKNTSLVAALLCATKTESRDKTRNKTPKMTKGTTLAAEGSDAFFARRPLSPTQ